MSWLSSLPLHPIFALPLESSSSTSTLPTSTSPPTTPAVHPSYSSLSHPSHPSSPALPKIFPPSSSTKPSLLQPTTPSRTPKNQIKKHEQLKEVEKLGKGVGKRKSRMCVIAGDACVVAVGMELRVCSLKRVKNGVQARRGNEEDAELGDYKVLNTGITYDIQELVLNQTSKLLACIGIHSISVISLPSSSSFLTSPSTSIDVRCLEVGKFYHSLPGSPSISSALFHPLGQHSTCLLILTSDSQLREYTLHESSTEPSQTLSFLREDEMRKGKGFSAEDEGERETVGMCLGDERDQAGWGRLTLYAVMRNGDIRSLCPFLPKRTSIPLSYLHALHSYTSTKLDLLRTSNPSSSSALTLSRSTDHPSSSPSSSAPSSSSSDKLEKLHSLQLQYLQTLLRQIPSSSSSSSTEDEDSLVDVTAPITRPSLRPQVQGPYLLYPSPIELEHEHEDNEFEPRVTDLMYVGGSEGGVGRLLVGSSNGKLEIYLEVEKPHARFTGSEGIQEKEVVEGPMMFVRETLDLGFTEGEGEGEGWVTMRKDPLYEGETVWVYSKDGVQCLVLGSVEEEEEEMEESQVYWVVKTRSEDVSDEKGNEVVGLEVIGDVYLGYCLIALTGDLQVVGVELSLRVDQESLLEVEEEKGGKEEEEGGYKSLLESSFILPQVFSSKKGSRLPPPLDSTQATKGELKITPDSLRTMGKQVELYQSSIRELVEGADQVQHRLELQMKELSRQLSSLHELRKLSGDLRDSTSGDSGLVGRMKRVEQVQVRLLERLDRALQKLMEKHQGRDQLSLYEKKWFEELKRVEREQVGLGAKTRRVEAMWDELREGVEDMSERKRRDREGTPVKGGLGKDQVRGLEEKLSVEARLLADAKKKVERLTHSLSQTTI